MNNTNAIFYIDWLTDAKKAAKNQFQTKLYSRTFCSFP